MEKKVVHYIGTPLINGIGKSAILTPVDHPDKENVSNARPVRTSAVVKFGIPEGTIETQNTIYKPYGDISEDVEGGWQ